MVTSLAGRRIAVIGGTGFIGSHLVERLVREGADVLAIGRSARNLGRLASVRGDCAVALCDLADAEGVQRTFAEFRPEIVYHMAAHPDGSESFEQFAACLTINGIGLVNALQASVECGAELFVYGDSTKVYGGRAVPYRASDEPAPLCSYAVVKAAGWRLCELATAFAPLQIASIRPTFVYGPRQTRNLVTHVQECVLAGRPIRLQGGTQTRDPLFVADAVAAFAAVPQHPDAWGRAIPIGGGSEMTVTSLCEAVLSALGTRLPIVADAAAARPTEVWRSSADNADAQRLLDWLPRVSLAEGLARTVAAWADPAGATSTWFAPPAGPTASPVGSQFLYELAPDVRFAVIDRRRAGDRRAVPRGGRRPGDEPAAVAVALPAFAGQPEAGELA
jgi:nucleoside-diphosphate-sugar epimerase